MTKVNSYVNVVTDQIKKESIFHHIYLYASRREKIAQMVEIDPTLFGYVYDNAVFEDKYICHTCKTIPQYGLLSNLLTRVKFTENLQNVSQMRYGFFKKSKIDTL